MKRTIIGIILCAIVLGAQAGERPNILWLTSEDNGLFLGCYGDTHARTPNLDTLAGQGIRYTRCFANAPVCAVARSSWIMGFAAPSLGMQHMRTKIRIPYEEMPPYPTLLQDAGYYVTNNSKTDYNTRSFDQDIWDQCGNQAHYKNRPAGKPFFAIFNIGESHEGQIFEEHETVRTAKGDWDAQPRVPGEAIALPPYLIRTEANLHDWGRMYDQLDKMDARVGHYLRELHALGEAENTIVVYCSDHSGITLRSKRYLHDSGTHVPLIAYFPPKWQHLAPKEPGSVSDRLVQFIDMPRTWLALAGAELPARMTGSVFLGDRIEPAPEWVYLFSNRFDEVPDTSRGLTDGRWKYIRNYEPDRPRFQMLWYPFRQAGQVSQWEAFQAGITTPAQSAPFLPQPSEELYDTWTDPHEISNLIPSCPEKLEAMRRLLDEQILETRDLSFLPETLMMEIDQSDGPTIYAYGQSEANYPLKKILPLANLVSEKNPDHVPAFCQALKSENETIRHWGALGLRVLGAQAVEAKPVLIQALKDASPAVRIPAAVALGRMGERAMALEALLEESERTKEDIHALWVLDALKLLQAPEVVKQRPRSVWVKGGYSGRTYDLLSKGGHIANPAR